MVDALVHFQPCWWRKTISRAGSWSREVVTCCDGMAQLCLILESRFCFFLLLRCINGRMLHIEQWWLSSSATLFSSSEWSALCCAVHVWRHPPGRQWMTPGLQENWKSLVLPGNLTVKWKITSRSFSIRLIYWVPLLDFGPGSSPWTTTRDCPKFHQPALDLVFGFGSDSFWVLNDGWYWPSLVKQIVQ